jgi:hypothetical protein
MLTAIFACKPKVENAEVKTIDSLLVVLDESEQRLKNINYEQLEEATQIVNKEIACVQPLLKDTLSISQQLMLNNYNIVSGKKSDSLAGQENSNDSYKKVRATYIEKEINFCKKQLLNLKNDFSNGNMDATSFKKYFDVEKEKSLQIINFVSNEKNAASHRLAVFDSLHPLVLKLIDSLQIVAQKKK